MARKEKAGTPNRARYLEMKLQKGETVDAATARAVVTPLVANASTALDYSKEMFPDLSLNDCVNALQERCESIIAGDLAAAESTLSAQAVALDAVFNSLAKRAIHAEYMDNFERYLRLALKAQSQCRATLETLVAIKNPPVIYAKQANIANGPQQVNNGAARFSQAGEIQSEHSQLSGGTHELLPDTRASSDASRANPTLETLGEINRTEVRRG